MRGERFHVCLGCFARQVRLDACVRCGSRALVDLRTPAGRAEVAGRAAETAREREVLAEQSGREAAALVVGVAIGGVALLVQVAAGVGGVMLAPTALAVAVIVPLLALAMLRRRGADDAALLAMTPRLECADRVRAEAAEPPRALARVTGRVRVTRAVVGPLSGRPCAAAGVAGSAFGEVDDAVCGAFELLDAQGAVVARYGGEGASVDVPLGEATVRDGAEGGLREFLDARMVYREGARVSVAEGAVLDGDLVTLEGPADDAVVAEGYRESRAVKVFRGTAAWPVTVRREAEPPTRVRVDPVEDAREVAEVSAGAAATGASRRR